MTEALPFLTTNESSKDKLLEIAKRIYGKGITLSFEWDNGKYPSEWRANRGGSMHFYTLIQFKEEDMTEEAISKLGRCDEWDWRYFYAISVCAEDRELYLLSFNNRYSPNWNGEYNMRRLIALTDVGFPILKEHSVIYRIDDALHNAINTSLLQSLPMFTEDEDKVVMMVKDQHGNYTAIEGTTIEQVFRNYADNYTGYRNFRRQMASEWVIVDDKARLRFEEWKRTAKGLKSDFDKFYGGGIVD